MRFRPRPSEETMQTQPIPPQSTDRGAWLANVAWRALAHTDSISLPHSHKRLLADAAFETPLCCEAARRVEIIAEDVLGAVDPLGDAWDVS
jgi:hypothetical protein